MVYLDNAATTAMSEVALSSLMEVSTHIYGNPSSVYRFGRQTKRQVINDTLIVGVDVGLQTHFCRAFGWRGCKTWDLHFSQKYLSLFWNF